MEYNEQDESGCFIFLVYALFIIASVVLLINLVKYLEGDNHMSYDEIKNILLEIHEYDIEKEIEHITVERRRPSNKQIKDQLGL